MDTSRLSHIVSPLLDWFSVSARDLPWRRDREPYHVWLSEIMLQQTRVEAVKGYYARFLAAAPDVFALAALPEDALMKLWEGLGYYNRARNLQKCAKALAESGARFPETKEGLLALPGIGDYTAGAIASICFEQPCAAVDGNVLRVGTRVLEDFTPIDDASFKKELAAALGEVYPKGRCGDFTQALMELGATVCVPNGEPKCDIKRPAKGLLAGLWELPNTAGLLSEAEAGAFLSGLELGDTRLRAARDGEHIFTHIRWVLRCYTVECEKMPETFTWVSDEQLRDEIGLPTAFRQFIEI